MKLRIIASVVLVMVLSAGITNKAEAGQWRGYHRGGWHTPHRVVRVYPQVIVPRVVVGGYYARPYVAPAYYGNAYHRHAYHHHYCYR